MIYSTKDFVTPNQILADVVISVKDEEYLHHSPGWFISQMQQALEELSFDTFFNEKVIEFDMPANLNLEIPKGVFNIKEVFAFSGENLCSIQSSQIIWPKRNFFTKGNGYLARNKSGSTDPFYGNELLNHASKAPEVNTDPGFRKIGNENTFYYGLHNGVMMVSPSCLKFNKIAIKFNGVGCEIGDEPIIPLFFRQAVKDYCCEAALRDMMVDNPNFREAWKVYDRNLNKNENYGFYTGSWYKAKDRVSRMNTHEKQALREYLAKPAW